MLMCNSGRSCISLRYTHPAANMNVLMHIDLSKLLVGTKFAQRVVILSTLCIGFIQFSVLSILINCTSLFYSLQASALNYLRTEAVR